ncbi:hypothetical protein [Microbacterium terricola]|uniref:Uncharacterized protein n=1 Tax=Microbacterium terricola TaxID=344163 RepID=A0ABM8E1F2_9MICO|nr:hypothetical protein [Microbacterium terricola]UYK40628.1 hypothetical protein OAU46_02950 [Microbacterium terricola]BDV31639.1 hypothetical protein Microterr_22990 [Microbacterium terricola]
MTVPAPYPPTVDEQRSPLLRAAIWVAIGALIAAALVCVVWVLIGTQNGIVGRAFLTILLLAGFGGISILEAHLAPRRPTWFALASMGSWVVALIIGAVFIWMPERHYFGGIGRFMQFLLIVLILQLALLHIRLYSKALERHRTTFTQVVGIVTIALVVGLAALLIVPLVMSEYVRFLDIYWRIVVAVAILAAVGTALIPLVNALFAPRKPRPLAPHPHQAVQTAPPAPQQAWPTYVDGYTPLPVMPDGTPDWNAYYTGYPTVHAPAPEAPQQTSSAPGYEGFPPPPPLPPRP